MRDYKAEFKNRVDFIRMVLSSSGAEGIVFGNSGGFQRHAVHVLGIVMDFLDGAAVHGVVEVQEAAIPPGIGKGSILRLLAAKLAGDDVEVFGSGQVKFAAADAVLHVGNGGVATGGVVLQVIMVLRQLHTGSTDVVKEIRQVGIGHLDFGMSSLILP